MSIDSFEGHTASGCSISRELKEIMPLTVIV